MSKLDDWELVARAQGGDHEAFAALVRRYQGPVVHFCLRMVGNREEAEDLAQDCFVRLHGSLSRIQPSARFTTLLFGIARNRTLNYLRDMKRRGRGRFTSLDDQPLPDSPTRQPDRAAANAEKGDALLAAIAALPPRFREVLVLRELEDMNYEQIAEVLHCRVGTVRSRLSRARDAVRKHLLERGDVL